MRNNPSRAAGKPHFFILSLGAILLLGMGACSGRGIETGLATLEAGLEATLVPLGAAAEPTQNISPVAPSPDAGQLLPTGAPATVAAAAATEIPVSVTPSPAPTLAPEPPATTTPAPTATPAPVATALPIVAEIEVPGGKMIAANGGRFAMGAAAAQLMELCSAFRNDCDVAWFVSAEPVHEVLLDPFYIDSHEVTNESFAKFINDAGGEAALCLGQACLDRAQSQLILDSNIYLIPNDLGLRPVAGVTWYGASAYCAWRGARLPTEAEWEMAAAWDGAANVARRFPWGNDFNGKALNFCDANCQAPQANLGFNDAYGATAPVAYYDSGRSPIGLYDMAGNVREWVADWYDAAYYAISPGANPTGPSNGVEKVTRGGSWYDAGYVAASAVRVPAPPASGDRALGFRCAAGIR